MKRHVHLAIAAAVALCLVAAPVAAQDASPSGGPDASPSAAPVLPPGASEPPITGPAGPRIGDTVGYMSEAGRPLGAVVVDAVDPAFDEFSEFFSADPDSAYVAVQYTFSNPGDRNLEVSTFRLSLETAGGFLWGSAYMSRPDDVDVPDLESQFNLDPGETETGLVFFQVPLDSELVRLWWTPDSGRLLELADLRD